MTSSNKRVFQIPPPLTMVDLAMNEGGHSHKYLNTVSSRTSKYNILQKRVSLGSSGSHKASSGGCVRTIRNDMMFHSTNTTVRAKQDKKGDATIGAEGGKSKERDCREPKSTLNPSNQHNSTGEAANKMQLTMISPAKSTNTLKGGVPGAYHWQNVVAAATFNKRKNSIHTMSGATGQGAVFVDNNQTSTSTIKQIEMIKKKTSHKRLATLSSSSQNQINNNNPPFSKNLILTQLVQNTNYQTSQHIQSTSKKTNCTRNIENLLSSGGNKSNNCIFSSGNSKLIFRTSNDTIQFNKINQDLSQSSPLAISHFRQSSRRFFGRNSIEQPEHKENQVKMGQKYQCETGASMDHKISPLLSQNSILQNTSINCTQGAIVAQPTVTNRPQSNLAGTSSATQGILGPFNLFNFPRPSFDQADIKALNHSDRLVKPLITNYEEHFENVSSEDDYEGKISYKSSTSKLPKSDNDSSPNSSIDERGFATSQCDMIQTTGCSILEGKTGIKLPISQIKTCALQLIMQPGQLLKQNNKADIAVSSQKTTERNHKPLNRPQILNYPQPGLVVQNILAQSRSPNKRGQSQKQKAKLQLQKHTRSTILDGTIQELSGVNAANINKSRSTSPASDVDAEYFCGGGLNNTGGSHNLRRTKKTEKSFELMSQSSQSKWTLLDAYCKKGDVLSIAQLIQGDSKLLQDYKRKLLYKSLEYRQYELLKFLLTHPKHKDNDSYNLLHISLRPSSSTQTENDIMLLKVILKYDNSADLNEQDTYGNTPVHLAAQNGRVDILRLFLKKHLIKLSLKNSEGKSAIEYAKDPKILELFSNYLTYLRTLHTQEVLEELRLIDCDHAIQSKFKILKKDRSQQSMKENQSKNLMNKSSTSTVTPKAIPSKQIIQFAQKKSSAGYKCETEPILISSKKKNEGKTKDMIYIGSEKMLKVQKSFDDGNGSDSQSLEICEQIEEVSDESLQNSLVKNFDSKIGPHLFEPLSLIGKGSFGEVYLVRKREGKKEQLYAMKVLQKETILGQNLVKYAITERNVLSMTKHPFIVGLNYAFQTKDKLFLILDYCPGGDLGKVLEREKRFDESRAKIYLSEILLALEDLHKRDIIFRDLKPDNVVLDAQGHALLTDFGLSKQGVLDNQAAKSFCGSVAYLAPEMLKGSGHGKSVDWYLLGVLLYEMLVGMPPYFNKDRKQLVSNIQKGPLLIPTQLSQEAKDLIIALLSKNPLRRLGAGIRDADEIKEHPFFKDIDWQRVYNKQLKPPKPKINKIVFLDQSQKISYEQILAKDQTNKQENALPGWSFANTSKT